MDFFDYIPQKFYLLSAKKRVLVDFSSADHEFAQVVDDVFSSLKSIRGGNIHSLYRYCPEILVEMQRLSDKYKDMYPNVQQIPKFLKVLEDGEIFIRQKSNVDLIDLKRAILEIESRSLGIDFKKADDIFVLNWGSLYLTYDAFSYGFLSDKIYIGEKDKSKRVCRFCKGTGINRYKNISHALQESLGNHLLFSLEECDECNSYFSNNVEIPLFRFLEINRNLSQVKGKKSAIHNQEGLNFHIHPDENTQEPVVYVKQETIINDYYKGRATGRILLYNKGAISYLGIYKALVKFAVDMVPSNLKNHFIRTGEWVHGDFEDTELPPFSFGEHNFFYEQPVLDLFFRNGKSPKYSPYCTAVLYIFDCIFIYTLPFSDIDTDLKLKANDIIANLEHFKKYEYIYVQEWVEYDSNDLTERAAHYKVNAIGENGKYRVEYRPSTDSVFEIKR